MKIFTCLSLCVFLQIGSPTSLHAQEKIFNSVIEAAKKNWGGITAVAQDPQGYIWFSSIENGGVVGAGGIHKFDGRNITSYIHEAGNANSLTDDFVTDMIIDSAGIIWVSTRGGLDRFDPVTNTFTHFHHDPKDPFSLSSDTIFCLLDDHSGNLWVGTVNDGLNLFNKANGKCTQYKFDPKDKSSLSNNKVRKIYKDRSGTLWVGCGNLLMGDASENGGLNRFDRITGKFTRYLHDPKDPNSISNNKVSAIFEDSKGTFWVGTAGDGLHTLDRATGKFTHYYYDPTHPEKLSRPVYDSSEWADQITFFTEDGTGAIWIGTFSQGLNKYDPSTKKITHYGLMFRDGRAVITPQDDGLTDNDLFDAFSSNDGTMWISTLNGNLFKTNPTRTKLNYYPINTDANSFYLEPATNILWIATSKGLIRKELSTGAEQKWAHDPRNVKGDNINVMRVDANGKFWLATSDGLSKFDPISHSYTDYWPDSANKHVENFNDVVNVLIDRNNDIWLAMAMNGVYKMDHATGRFTSYKSASHDSSSLSSNNTICISEDRNKTIWVGTFDGLDKLDRSGHRFQHYLKSKNTKTIFEDAAGTVWAGSVDALYRYDRTSDQFKPYTDPNANMEFNNILHIMEDDKRNLWVSTKTSVIRINEARNQARIFGANYGIHVNSFLFSDNFIGSNGQAFIGDQGGYYSFFPSQLNNNNLAPQVSFTSLRINDAEVKPSQGDVITKPIWLTKEIKLNYEQNVFSLEFMGLNYSSPDPATYLFMLENYDNNWHHIGTDNRAIFFNVPPGKYTFRVRAVSSDGLWSEKQMAIIITPPWWKTWWAYTIFVLAFIAALWGIISYRSNKLKRENRLLEEKIATRTHQLRQSLDDLKATQSQLIQSEKMASLGELTAGIAHEIQNPLNFVNNFSEVNKELLAEMDQEIEKGNLTEIRAIAKDVVANEEKINHHGKRADAIVKGMLQHSRTSSGQKELTDINALADEYLRLTYHGLRAKDKSFNAKFETDFDNSIGKIPVVPQDIGRVTLNLISNAFYAASLPPEGGFSDSERTHIPTVWLGTKKNGSVILITVRDNGPGIPAKIIDKIFQPFFTTKPTGQGTGLGLSLSYDIIKAHGGEIAVNTKEGEGTEFVVRLPIA